MKVFRDIEEMRGEIQKGISEHGNAVLAAFEVSKEITLRTNRIARRTVARHILHATTMARIVLSSPKCFPYPQSFTSEALYNASIWNKTSVDKLYVGAKLNIYLDLLEAMAIDLAVRNAEQELSNGASIH